MMMRIARKIALAAMINSWFAVSAIAVVDDGVARAWVKKAYEFAGLKAESLDSLFTIAIDPTTSKTAWVTLKHCRDSGDSLDLNLAAAEHYLFIRWFAAKEGQLNVMLMPNVYDAMKSLGLGDILKLTEKPTSPPDPDVVRWGQDGARRGLKDFQKNTGQALDTYKDLPLMANGMWENYQAGVDNPKCKVSL